MKELCKLQLCATFEVNEKKNLLLLFLLMHNLLFFPPQTGLKNLTILTFPQSHSQPHPSLCQSALYMQQTSQFLSVSDFCLNNLLALHKFFKPNSDDCLCTSNFQIQILLTWVSGAFLLIIAAQVNRRSISV